jgi:hypothetical protein
MIGNDALGFFSLPLSLSLFLSSLSPNNDLIVAMQWRYQYDEFYNCMMMKIMTMTMMI